MSLLCWLSAGLYHVLMLLTTGSTMTLCSALLADVSTVLSSRQIPWLSSSWALSLARQSWYTVNQGLFSCNYQDVNCKHVFLFLNSVIQNQKATVSESSLLFLSWNYFPTQTTKCSLNFKKPFSTDLMTNFEIHGGSFWYSPNLLVQKICDRDLTVCVLIYEIEL